MFNGDKEIREFSARDVNTIMQSVFPTVLTKRFELGLIDVRHQKHEISTDIEFSFHVCSAMFENEKNMKKKFLVHVHFFMKI